MSGERQRGIDALDAIKKFLPRRLDSSGAATLGELALRTFNFATDVAEFLRLLVDAVQPKLPPIDSGAYVPVLIEVVNVDSSSVSRCNWLRIGDVVAVGGVLTVDATVPVTLTRVQMTLPVPSVLSSAMVVSGTGADVEGDTVAAIIGDTASNSAEFNWTANTASERVFSFSYVYRIEAA